MLRITVKEFLDSLDVMPKVQVVAKDSGIKEVVLAMVKGHRRRIVYVADEKGRLLGDITLDNLKDVIFHNYLGDRVTDAVIMSEHIADCFVSETAFDLMEDDRPVCYENEQLMEVLSRMIASDVKDVPVVNSEGKVIADLDILDLLAFWLKKGEEAF